MISKGETKSHNWGEKPEAQSDQRDAFTEVGRTKGEPTRNDPRSCKTVSAGTRAYFSPENVRGRLQVYAKHAPKIDPEDRAALRKYVERDMEAAR